VPIAARGVIAARVSNATVLLGPVWSWMEEPHSAPAMLAIAAE